MVLYILLKMIVFVRYYVDNIFNWMFSLYYTSRKESVKGINNNLLLESAVSLARKIRQGSVKSEEVVRAFIDRIKEVNFLLNAVVDNRFHDALQEANEIDRNIANKIYTEKDFQEKPFLGVPFTTKESTKCKGMRHTLAIKCRIDVVADEDAEVITKMKEAGGILLAITNIPQVNMWIETSNPIYGRTNNPYNTTINVGGSSGGEGSIISACGSPFGIGTDIGGSIRVPSFVNGIFGFKCSPDLTSTKGTTYRTGDEGPTMVVAGPMARYMEDIEAGLKVLIGKEMTDKLRLNEEVDVKQLKLFYSLEIDDPFVSQIRPIMKDCVERVVKYLQEYMKTYPEIVEFDEMKYTLKLWSYQLKQENNGKTNFAEDIANRERSVDVIEAIYNCVVHNEYTIPVLYNLIKNAVIPVNEKWASEMLIDLKRRVETKLGDNGVLIFPSWPFPPEYHHLNLLRPFNMAYTAIWNALKLPALQVPIGLSPDGLPLGVQIVAATNQDRLCLAVGKVLEKEFGGYVPPFCTKEKED